MADVPIELHFKDGTRVAYIFDVLSDGEWHCGKHELPGTQPAKYIQTLRQHGFQVVNRTSYCSHCADKTVHRRLISTSPTRASSLRLRIPRKLRQRIYTCYANVEAVTLREMSPTQLEIDHRFPQVRWSEDEAFDPYMPTNEIRRRFQLLTRANNLWKSRYCEHCKATGERGTFVGIAYFAEGGPCWNPAIPENDERGCSGCFWYNPDVWRRALNATLHGGQEEPATTPGEGDYQQLSFL